MKFITAEVMTAQGNSQRLWLTLHPLQQFAQCFIEVGVCIVQACIVTVTMHHQHAVDCTQIGLYDTQSNHPSIKYVHISDSTKGPITPVDLEEALPLQHLLAPVGLCKECIATAVDSLDADAAGRAPAQADSDLGSRSFGAALQAVLRFSTHTCIYLILHDYGHHLPLPFGNVVHKLNNLASSPRQHHMQVVSVHKTRHKRAMLCCLMLGIDTEKNDCCCWRHKLQCLCTVASKYV